MQQQVVAANVIVGVYFISNLLTRPFYDSFETVMEVLAQGTNSINVFVAVGLKSNFISTALANALLIGFNGATLGTYVLAMFATPILYCHNVLRISKMADVVQRQALAAANNFSRNFSKSVLQQAASGALSAAGDVGSAAALAAVKLNEIAPINQVDAEQVQVVIDKLGPAALVAADHAGKGAAIAAKAAVDIVTNPKESAHAAASAIENGAGALRSLGGAAAPVMVDAAHSAAIGVAHGASVAVEHGAPAMAHAAQYVRAEAPGAIQMVRVQAVSAAGAAATAVRSQ